MDAKLTLKLNQDVIEKAKQYAAERKMSLSRIIENYLQSLATKNVETVNEADISPYVRTLSAKLNVPADYDYKDELANYQTSKHR